MQVHLLLFEGQLLDQDLERRQTEIGASQYNRDVPQIASFLNDYAASG